MTDYDAMLTELHRQRGLAEANVARYGRHLDTWTGHRSSIEAQIKRTAEAKLAPAEPTPTDNDTTPVILFRKVFPGGVYTYAAIRASREPRPWTVTQITHGAMLGNLNWSDLLNFIGPEGWGNIRRLGSPTQLALACPEAPDTVDALGDDHIGSAWIDDESDRWEYRYGAWQWSDNGGEWWSGADSICHPDSAGGPYKRVAPATDPRDRIGPDLSYKGADFHGDDAPEWTLP